MARSSYLEFEVKHTKIEQGINIILKSLKALNAEYEKVKNLKFNSDTTGIKASAKDVDMLAKAFENYSKAVNNTPKTPKLPDTKETDKAVKNITNLAFAWYQLQNATKGVKLFADYESSIYNLAIASKKSISEVTKMKDEFLSITTSIPVAANNLAKVTDTLVRTGKSYADALKIATETAKLSVATGADLESTASTVSKLMTALQVNSKDTDKVLNTLHSTAIQTASSMESISGGFKQVAGVLGAVAYTSGKSGEELDNYKQKLISLGSAGIGVMNNLGKSASESSTKIKVFFSKLTAMEKNAKNLFNRDTSNYKLGDEYIKALGLKEGSSVKLTANTLADLARKDLPMAVQLMSELKVKGILAGETIQKIFTQRHALDIEVLLNQVNGDVDRFINLLTKGMDYAKDFNSQMFSLANNMKLFGNHLREGVFSESSAVGFFLNSYLYSINTMTNETNKFGKVANFVFTNLIGVGQLALTMAVIRKSMDFLGIDIAKAGRLFNTFVKNIITGTTTIKGAFAGIGSFVGGGLTSLLNPIGLLIVGVTALASAFYIFKKRQQESISDIDTHITKLDTLQKGYDRLKIALDSADSKINDFQRNPFGTMPEIPNIAEVITSGSKYFDDYRKAVGELNNIDVGKYISLKNTLADIKNEYKEISKTANESRSKLQLLYSPENIIELKKRQLQYIPKYSDYMQTAKYKDYSSTLQLWNEGKYKEYEKQLDILKEKYKDTELNITKITYELSKKLDIKIPKDTLENIDKTNEKLKDLENQTKDATSELEKAKEALGKMTSSVQNLSLQNFLDGLSQGVLYANGHLLDVTKNMDIFLTQLGEMAKTQNMSIIGNSIQALKDTLAGIDSQLAGNVDTHTRNQLESEKRQLQEKIDQMEEMLKSMGERSAISIANSLLEKIGIATNQISGKNVKLNVELALSTNEAMLNGNLGFIKNGFGKKKEQMSEYEQVTYARMLKEKEDLQNQLEEQIRLKTKLENQKLNSNTKKSSKSKTEYSVDYVKLQERSLDLEKEIEKIGKSKIEQDYIDYQYRMKTMILSLEDLHHTKESAKEKLNAIKITKQQVETEQQFFSRLEQRKAELEKIKNMQGEQGKKAKGEHQAIVAYLNAQISLENQINSIELERVKTLEKLKKDMKEMKKEMEDASFSYRNFLKDSGMLNKQQTDQLSQDTIEYSKRKIKDRLQDLNINNLPVDIREQFLNLSNSMSNGKYVNPNSFNDFTQNIINKISKSQGIVSDLEKKLQSNKKLNKEEQKLLKLQHENVNKYTQLSELFKDMQPLWIDILKEQQNVFKNKAERVLSMVDGGVGILNGANIFGRFGGVLSSGSNIFKSFFNQENGLGALIKQSGSNDSLGSLGQTMSKVLDNLDKKFDKNAFGTAGLGIELGSSLAQAFGDTTGLGQKLGAIGGLGTWGVLSLMGKGAATAGVWGAVAGLGLSLLGGVFGSRSAKKVKAAQEEANRKTEYANQKYQGNTNNLVNLANNFDGLKNVMISFNKNLVSTFSNLPTIDNIARIEMGMNRMYGDFNGSRNFGSAGYLTEESKRAGKSLFHRGRTVRWYKFHEIEQSGLLREFGYVGKMQDMTLDEMEKFSRWLKELKKGTANNFKEYSKVVENYVEAMRTLGKVMAKFGRETTYEGFQGISVTRQDELVKQITEMYKLANIEITENVKQTIKELSEQMSIMVTIMENVRTNFLQDWKETGKESGKSFVSSMRPYMESMLTNMSQIYFDTTFSKIVRNLEVEFKEIADRLYELKKKGIGTTWRQIYQDMKEPFGYILNLLQEGKRNTEVFSSALQGLQQTALERGLKLSELQSLGLLTSMQENMYKVFGESVQSDEMNGAISILGSHIGKNISEAMSKKLLDDMVGGQLVNLTNKLENVMSGKLGLKSLSELSQVALSTGLQLESERLKLTAIRDMFDFNKDINYQNQNNEIKYETGTSQTVVHNYYLNNSVNAGVVIPQQDIEEFVGATAEKLVEALKLKYGVDIINR